MEPFFRPWLMLCVAAFAAMAATTAPAHASGGVTGVAVSTCVRPDAKGLTAPALFRNPGEFNCSRKQIDFGRGDYWVLSGPLDKIPDLTRRTRVRIASVWQDSITLYALYPDGRILTLPLTEKDIGRHVQLGAIVEWRLPHHAQPPVRLLWHVRDSANLRGIVISPHLALPRESVRANLEMAAIYAAFGGLGLALLIYNLALWEALRHRFQLAYCAMVASLSLYALSSSGALNWLFPDLLNNDRMRVNYAMLATATLTAMLFARTFFEPEVTRGWTGRIVTAASALLLTTACLFVLFAPWHIQLFDRLYSWSFFGMLIAIVPIIVRARKQRSPYLWLFALAWSVPVAFACLRLAMNTLFVQWNFWVDNSTILSMSFEAIMSSAAIAYRIRVLSKERDEARTREMATRMLADTDPLTGLLNRRAFLSRIMQSEGKQMLLLADIDHFKQVNETLGHDGGDEVLRLFARALRDTTPANALIARLGGEEFAIVVPCNTGIDPDRLLARLRAARMPFDMTVTTSIGCCSGPLIGETDWKRLYRMADRALFAAKAAGRDRVRHAERIAEAA
ncbi:hypothetical protein GCM10023219_30590 [Stakelama sediminis]|uniref:diguanylate cyclase n=1 Tax=Stakelama sediminis TaxID=463200 RepID=A0A840Z293_9SPHN|nr:diguanylate cyclase [Stakelama sediminis]MBB5720035.1 diguanylate cyclase (GGDEF)-like protein [Stakelama sediminis]